MVAQDPTKDQEFELLSFGRLEDLGRSHVHEANVTKVTLDFALEDLRQSSTLIFLASLRRCRSQLLK